MTATPGIGLSITALVEVAHATAVEKGFWSGPLNAPVIFQTSQKLALIHSEVSEALEVLRRAEPADRVAFGEELADILIRTADLAGHWNIDLEDAVLRKLNLNLYRPPTHGKVF